MNTHIALLRGINVSGKKKVLMADLRALFESLAFKNVITYIQTGNVIFESVITEKETIEHIIHDAIKAHFGFEVPVLIIDFPILKTMVSSCPFPSIKKEKSYFTILKEKPSEGNIKALSLINLTHEEIIVTNQCVYFYSDRGYGNSKCDNNFIEKQLKVNATTRNYRTMVKLISLIENA